MTENNDFTSNNTQNSIPDIVPAQKQPETTGENNFDELMRKLKDMNANVPQEPVNSVPMPTEAEPVNNPELVPIVNARPLENTEVRYVQPSVVPTPVATSPAQPSVAPIPVAASPAQPSVAPTPVATSPVQPSVAPASVATRPVQPSVAPTPVAASPAQPSVAPAPIATSPVQPSVAPTPVAASPAQPSAAPAPVATSPVQPSVAPNPIKAEAESEASSNNAEVTIERIKKEINFDTFNNAEVFENDPLEEYNSEYKPEIEEKADIQQSELKNEVFTAPVQMPNFGSQPYFGNNVQPPVQPPVQPSAQPPLYSQPGYYGQIPVPVQYAQPIYGGYQPVQIPAPVQMPIPVQPPVPMAVPPVPMADSMRSGYNQPVQPPQRPIKKKNPGGVVYLTFIALLFLFFLGAFIFYSADKAGNGGFLDMLNGMIDDSLGYATPSEPEKNTSSSPSNSTPEDEDTGINPDGPNIKLENVRTDGEYSARAAYRRVNPSVVSILVYENDTAMEKEYTSEGSGVIISSDGYIVTNSHVILNSKSGNGIQIVLYNDDVYTGKVVGFDTRTDLAVIKIKASKLIPAEFMDSDLIEIGEDVVAVGNPGGIEFSHSITKGIISAKDRPVSSDNYVKYIQTDTAINPGNSGGPLTNLYGQVIGINTIKIVDEEYEGMGFAIPSRVVKTIVDDLITKGYVQNRVRLGIKGQVISLYDADRYDIEGGITIIEFTNDSVFAGTMAKVNDIIVELDGKEIDCFATLYEELELYSPGDKVVITLYRPSENKKIKVTVTLLSDTGQSQN